MTIEITVDDMTCDGCEDIVEAAVEDVAGVDDADADREDDVVAVEGDAEPDEVVEAVELAGYSGSA